MTLKAPLQLFKVGKPENDTSNELRRRVVAGLVFWCLGVLVSSLLISIFVQYRVGSAGAAIKSIVHSMLTAVYCGMFCYAIARFGRNKQLKWALKGTVFFFLFCQQLIEVVSHIRTQSLSMLSYGDQIIHMIVLIVAFSILTVAAKTHYQFLLFTLQASVEILRYLPSQLVRGVAYMGTLL